MKETKKYVREKTIPIIHFYAYEFTIYSVRLSLPYTLAMLDERITMRERMHGKREAHIPWWFFLLFLSLFGCCSALSDTARRGWLEIKPFMNILY